MKKAIVFVTVFFLGAMCFAQSSGGGATPAIPVRIMGQGKVSQKDLIGFLYLRNDAADSADVEDIIAVLIIEAALEGINHDIAFAQMCLETDYLRFGSTILTRKMNNFCGLGATGKDHPGEQFPSINRGLRAQMQHLKVYASKEPLNTKLIDPRYNLVVERDWRGAAPDIYGLTKKWASDPQYGNKIYAILQSLYEYTF